MICVLSSSFTSLMGSIRQIDCVKLDGKSFNTQDVCVCVFVCVYV